MRLSLDTGVILQMTRLEVATDDQREEILRLMKEYGMRLAEGDLNRAARLLLLNNQQQRTIETFGVADRRSLSLWRKERR